MGLWLKDAQTVYFIFGLFEEAMRGQGLLLHVVGIRPADLELDYEVYEGGLHLAEAVGCRQLLVVLDGRAEHAVHILPPVGLDGGPRRVCP